jgi:hypothetical protein
VCERDGAALYVAWVVGARLYRGRGCANVSLGAVLGWNCRRNRDASDSTLCLSSLDVLSSEDKSEKATEERLDGRVGERGATMSRKWRSSKDQLAKGVNGGDWS